MLSRGSDTLSFRRLAFPQPGQLLVQPVVLGPLDFSDSALVNNFPVGFLRSAMLLQPDMQPPQGLLSPLRFQTNHRNPWKIVFTALGVIQAGGTAYLTYRALEKYGYIR